MEIESIRSVAELSTSANATEQGGELGRTQFLELMIAQLQSQDPLDPTQNEDFVAQLAQFSSLEGIENLNNAMSEMASAMRSSLTVDAAALVGRNVLAPTSQATLADVPIKGAIEVGDAASDVLLEISGANGEVVRRISLGFQAPGQTPFVWDGTADDGSRLEPGTYHFRALAAVDGEAVELQTKLPDRVVSVSLADGDIRVNLSSGGSVPLAHIEEVS
jgi:flagellar basal-body rod modification protein FlgD